MTTTSKLDQIPIKSPVKEFTVPELLQENMDLLRKNSSLQVRHSIDRSVIDKLQARLDSLTQPTTRKYRDLRKGTIVLHLFLSLLTFFIGPILFLTEAVRRPEVMFTSVAGFIWFVVISFVVDDLASRETD